MLRGSVDSIVPLDRFEVVHNGRVIEEIPLTGDRRHSEFEKEIQVTTSGWYTLEASADNRSHPIEQQRPMATTNPVYVLVGDQPIRNKESADYFVEWIEKLTEMANEHPGWRSDQERDHVLAQFNQAREIYVQRGLEATAP